MFTVLAIAQSNDIVIGKIDSINSIILNEKRPIWVYVPNNETSTNDATQKYPVVYLLDGDWHFTSVVGMLQQLSYVNGNTICPEMIVVGIPLKDRYKDLTPTCDSAYSNSSGGYHDFISFISDELIPHIDATYPTAPHRILIGHSLGGLATINTLNNFPNLFNSYIAIDPSMWWDQQISLKATEKFLRVNNFDNKSLFLAIANSMNSDMDTITVRNDRTRSTLPIRSLLELSDSLNTNTHNNLNFKIQYYKNENHGSVPLIATYDALHFIFDFYNLPIRKKDYSDTTSAFVQRIENHYKTLTIKMGYEINPSENFINTLGYNALFMNNLPMAEYFFTHNLKNFPVSANAFDSMGDYYMAVSDKKRAVEMFKHSLLLKENPDIRKKLELIENE